MDDQRKRQRTESMAKLVSQKKESKLWYEEANSHIKSENLPKALFSYNKMALGNNNIQIDAEKRLSITREAELLQSFVRVNVDDDEGSQLEKNGVGEVNKEEIDETVKTKQVSLDDSVKPNKDITQEVKKRGRRRRKRNGRHEELYCDKDRAAAVNMGSKDIKQSLKLKRKQDRSKMLQIPEEAEPSTFLALGNYEMGRGDLRIALNFMTKALELNPSEKNALVARSKCFILMGQPENALQDAETALQIDHKFLKAIYQKAEALYYLGNFEHSLMYYHRGLHIRPDHEGFKLGVHKAQKAIENAIGAAFPKNEDSTITKLSISSGRSSCRSNTNSSMSRSGTTLSIPVSRGGKSAKTSRLLRELGADKEYLDNLINNPNIKCKFKQDDNKIENCIKETVEFLNKRQEFWRQQMPPNFK